MRLITQLRRNRWLLTVIQSRKGSRYIYECRPSVEFEARGRTSLEISAGCCSWTMMSTIFAQKRLSLSQRGDPRLAPDNLRLLANSHGESATLTDLARCRSAAQYLPSSHHAHVDTLNDMRIFFLGSVRFISRQVMDLKAFETRRQQLSYPADCGQPT